jgi:hypothetical protein
VKNYETIMETLDEHEDEFSALAEGLDTAEGDERTRGLMKLLGAPVSKELQAALSRQGMGNNGFAKTMTILFGLIMVALEDGLLDADNSDEEERAEAEEQIALFRKAMNGADVKLISQRKNELMPLLGHGF